MKPSLFVLMTMFTPQWLVCCSCQLHFGQSILLPCLIFSVGRLERHLQFGGEFRRQLLRHGRGRSNSFLDHICIWGSVSHSSQIRCMRNLQALVKRASQSSDECLPLKGVRISRDQTRPVKRANPGLLYFRHGHLPAGKPFSDR